MILETQQQLTLPTRLGPVEALAFVQQPQQVLAHLHFLQDLQVDSGRLSGVLALHVPMVGEVTLPFVSLLQEQPSGAALLPQPLSHERAWLEIAGQAHSAEQSVHYDFTFRAHLQTPSAEQWGAKAFEKMVQASAQRSIARISEALPAALQAALTAAENAQS